MSKAPRVPENAPDDVKEFMARNASTWATRTNEFGQITTYFSPDFEMPEDPVLTPTVSEPGSPGTL